MSDGRIECKICGARVHAMRLHLQRDHAEMTEAAYLQAYPGAELLSEAAKTEIAKRAKRADTEGVSVGVAGSGAAATATVHELIPQGTIVKQPFHEVFNLGTKAKAAMSADGKPIPISTVSKADQTFAPIPTVDEGYVYEIDILKNVLLGLELNIPVYIWGFHGTGKTTLLEQVAARTGRPFLRVQHTINTEESHILGQWTVKDGHTVFEYGPLAVAMLHGLVYCADEYDFAMPSVLSVYQPVLEGKSLVIKDAPAAQRIITPHPNFRFVATGNTNGSGDETGLYQGTNIQNAANYDRFGVVEQKHYMQPSLEVQILQNQARIVETDAKKLVEFAQLIREAFAASKIGSTVSPRALIYAAKLGARRASFRVGINLAFSNKLPKVDREVVDGIAQRVFGS